MSYEYGDGLYETMGAAQDAAIDAYLTATGTQSVSDGIDPGDTARDIAQDMIRDGWQVPGVDYHLGNPADTLAAIIRRRLHDHGIEIGEGTQ